jgi:hypothetical protein
MRPKRIILEDHSQVPFFGRHPDFVSGAVDHLFVDPDTALIGTLQTGNHAQECGLAGAGRPQKSDNFLGLDVKIDMLYSRLCSLRISFADLFQAENGRAQWDSFADFAMTGEEIVVPEDIKG